uniref:Uncharacterized protein n=1 Tax=viral metagenome TaxID=1070528 RepID=A0A6C0LI01_9ZZZZ
MPIDPTANIELTPMVMGKIALEDGIHRMQIGEDGNKLATMTPDLSVKVHLTRADLAICLRNLELEYGSTFNETNSAFSPGGAGLEGFNNPNVHVHTAGSSFDLAAMKELRNGLGEKRNHGFWLGQALAGVDHYAPKSAVKADGTSKEPMKLTQVITGSQMPAYDQRNPEGKDFDRHYLNTDGQIEKSNDVNARKKAVDVNYTLRDENGDKHTWQYIPFNTNYTVPNAKTYGGLPEAFIRSISNNFYDITAGDEFALRALTQPAFIQELAGFWFDGCRVRNGNGSRNASNFQWLMSGASYPQKTLIESNVTMFPPDEAHNSTESSLGYIPEADTVHNPWDSPYGATILKNIVQQYYNRESNEMLSFDLHSEGDKTKIRLGDAGLQNKVATINLYMIVNASIRKNHTNTTHLKSEAMIDGQSFSEYDKPFCPDYDSTLTDETNVTTGFETPNGDGKNWVLRVKLVFDQPNTVEVAQAKTGKLNDALIAAESELQSLTDSKPGINQTFTEAESSHTTKVGAQTVAQNNYNSNPSAQNAIALEQAKANTKLALDSLNTATQTLSGIEDEITRQSSWNDSVKAARDLAVDQRSDSIKLVGEVASIEEVQVQTIDKLDAPPASPSSSPPASPLAETPA